MPKKIAFRSTGASEFKKDALFTLPILGGLTVAATIAYRLLLQFRIRDIVHFDNPAAVTSWRSDVILIYIIYAVIIFLTTAFVLFFVDRYQKFTGSAPDLTNQPKHLSANVKEYKMRTVVITQILFAVITIVLLILITRFGGGGRPGSIIRIFWFHTWRGFFIPLGCAYIFLVHCAVDKKLSKTRRKFFK